MKNERALNLKVGDKVKWVDPDPDYIDDEGELHCINCGRKDFIKDIEFLDEIEELDPDADDGRIFIVWQDGSEVEAMAGELS